MCSRYSSVFSMLKYNSWGKLIIEYHVLLSVLFRFVKALQFPWAPRGGARAPPSLSADPVSVYGSDAWRDVSFSAQALWGSRNEEKKHETQARSARIDHKHHTEPLDHNDQHDYDHVRDTRERVRLKTDSFVDVCEAAPSDIYVSRAGAETYPARFNWVINH